MQLSCSTIPERNRQREKNKTLLDICLEKCRGGSLSSHAQIHAAARKGAISCTAKYFLPCHGFIGQAKSKHSGRHGQPAPACTPGCILSLGMILPSKESNFSCSSEPNNELLSPLLIARRIVLKIHYFPE